MSVFTLTNPHMHTLLAFSRKLKDVSSAMGLLSWDQETYLPAKGAFARAQQLETLAGILHDMATATELGTTLSSLQDEIEKGDAFTPHDLALIRVMQRDYDLATKLPKTLVEALSKAQSMGLEHWRHARAMHSFADFAPALQTILDLKKEVAYARGFTTTPYDVLLDEYEEGLDTATVNSTFASLKGELVPLIPKIVEQTASWDSGVFRRHYDTAKLRTLSDNLLTWIGFDTAAGRQDESTHPFTMSLAPTDVRVTTRVLPTNPLSTLSSTIHEAGHGMYEQGVAPEITESMLGVITSLVIHESQSRFFENMIGKHPAFWEFLYPRLQATFPEHLLNVDADTAWKEANVVRPSLIRVDADEVTYHLHIIIRTELEQALLEGRLAVKDLPEAWNTAYATTLGVSVPSDTEGVLQDIHWSQGLIGYFPTYTLGSMLSVQLADTVFAALPDLASSLRSGTVTEAVSWLKNAVHAHGRMKTADTIAREVTGAPLTSAPLLAYIRRKYAV